MELSRLWRWALPKTSEVAAEQADDASPARASASEVHASAVRGSSTASSPAVPAPDNSNARAPDNSNAQQAETFFEQLAREQPPVPDGSAEDEPRISALVVQVVGYVMQKKLDPPVVPALVPRVLAITGEPEVDVVRLTHVIQTDLAISAKLLSVANSAMFGASAEIKSVRQAVAHLGTEQVAQIAIGLACRSSLDSGAATRSPFAARWTRLFAHGMTCAFAAAQLAGKSDKALQESAFLGGLFHDVGKAVALRAIEALLASGKISGFDEPIPDSILDEVLQRIHADPGEEFYSKWTLPESLMLICAHHHQLDIIELDDRAFHLVALSSCFDSLHRGGFAERRVALAEAQVSAGWLGLSDVALRAAYGELKILGDRTSRLFA